MPTATQQSTDVGSGRGMVPDSRKVLPLPPRALPGPQQLFLLSPCSWSGSLRPLTYPPSSSPRTAQSNVGRERRKVETETQRQRRYWRREGREGGKGGGCWLWRCDNKGWNER